jgi:hypothetical protein
MNEFWFRISFVLIFSSLSVIITICRRMAEATGRDCFRNMKDHSSTAVENQNNNLVTIVGGSAQ